MKSWCRSYDIRFKFPEWGGVGWGLRWTSSCLYLNPIQLIFSWETALTHSKNTIMTISALFKNNKKTTTKQKTKEQFKNY